MPNRLQNSPSAYLQQHAHNPVDWWPWGNEAWETAAAKGQWVVLSIGYSTCHWCHAMERDVFEQPAAAEAMSDFVCIKVDREERPDVDQVYMQAALAMNGNGGWPLNLIVLPDGRPIWAGTYLTLDRWMDLLQRIRTVRTTQPAAADDYAHQVEQALRSAQNLAPNSVETPTAEPAAPIRPDDLWDRVASGWDVQNFGHRRNQPFPLSDEWLQAAQSSIHRNHPAALLHATQSVLRWHASGSYDRLDGGLMRYATEPSLRIPHFEKMLYDNALYATACSSLSALIRHPKAHYPAGDGPHGTEATAHALQTAAADTLHFLDHHLLQPNGLYGAGWDADSEGHEGRYYTWPEEELHTTLGTDAANDLIQSLRAAGGAPWEGRWILHRDNIAPNTSDLLRAARIKRIPPFQDPKALLGWNALAVSAWAHAARWGSDPAFATKRATELGHHLAYLFFPSADDASESVAPARVLYPNGSRGPRAQLDDVVLAAQAFLHLASLDSDPNWLSLSVAWTERALRDYPHLSHGTASTAHDVPDRPFLEAVETEDSVVPSANAVLIEVLHHLGLCTGRMEWIALAQERAGIAKKAAAEHPSSHTHFLGFWTAIEPTDPKTERCVWTFNGPDAVAWRARADQEFLLRPEDPVLLESGNGTTGVTRCTQGQCSAPYTNWEAFRAAASFR
ncbi:MAG: DUF255 domain-containing protein [Schleiferiaceae bacterium]|nr:DUF255 domain-containing protein [Schleiferiaceae bacterium]MDP4859707.1 DUF255 domain-containing protein [Schleiferiaceae bacterium]MDP4901389.1 DUF255 domain-containing protein [Schleiferiaceae bacterium]